MRIKREKVGVWVEVKESLMEVMSIEIEIGREKGGDLDEEMGDEVKEWGLGKMEEDKRIIREDIDGKRVEENDEMEIDI